MTNERLATLDALRGLAALSVCWFHLTNTYGSDSAVRASGSLGWLGVEIFFVISGFVIPFALDRGGYRLESDWGRFIVKRFVRIEPPYLVAVLLALGLWYVSAAMPNFAGVAPDPSAWQLLSHVGYLTEIAGLPWLNPVFWSLAIEFQFYLMISLTFWAWSSERRLTRLTSLCIAGAAALLLPQKFLVFHWLPMFAAGIAAFHIRTGRIRWSEYVLALALAILAVGHLDGIAVASVAAATSLMLAMRVDISFRPLLGLGTISYSLYLVHVPIGSRVVNFGRSHVSGSWGELLLSTTALLACLIAAYVFYRMIERPSQAMASAVKYGRSRSQTAVNE